MKLAGSAPSRETHGSDPVQSTTVAPGPRQGPASATRATSNTE